MKAKDLRLLSSREDLVGVGLDPKRLLLGMVLK